MAVEGIPGRPRVLARDAAGLRPLLREAGLIDDQHATRLVPEVLLDVLAQIVAHRIDVPRGSVQEALDAFCSALTDRFGQLPAVLALDAIEQTGQVAALALAHLGTREARGDPPVQLIEDVGTAGDGARSATYRFRNHAPSFSSGEQCSASCAYVSL